MRGLISLIPGSPTRAWLTQGLTRAGPRVRSQASKFEFNERPAQSQGRILVDHGESARAHPDLLRKDAGHRLGIRNPFTGGIPRTRLGFTKQSPCRYHARSVTNEQSKNEPRKMNKVQSSKSETDETCTLYMSRHRLRTIQSTIQTARTSKGLASPWKSDV